MRVTTQGEYGLRCMIYIGKHSGNGPVSIHEISRCEELPRTYVEQLLLKLRRNHLIRSIRGVHGGYLLARPSKDITVGEIIRALEGNIFEIVCERRSKSKNPCIHNTRCALNPLWLKVRAKITELLEGINLEDLVEQDRLGPV